MWQGKIYSIEGSTAKYPNLAEATGYGTVTGLKGANCAHDFWPYIEGLSERTYFPVDDEENAKIYEQSQQQRKLEREIREQKRRAVAFEAAGDKEGLFRAQLALKDKEAQLKDFLRKTGRVRLRDREQVLGFGHSQASKAVWGEKRHYSLQLHKKGLEVSPKDVAKHRQLQYTDPPEYELQQKYLRSVDAGMLSPLCGYENYKRLHAQIASRIVGLTTSNGIPITGQSDHFIERVVGTMSDPTHSGRPRSGVEIEAVIDALKNGKVHKVKMTKDRKTGSLSPSLRFSSDRCDVTINPQTGQLIQCNPV